jgi:hypothetical protein
MHGRALCLSLSDLWAAEVILSIGGTWIPTSRWPIGASGATAWSTAGLVKLDPSD